MGGYTRHVLLCVGEGCCGGVDHQATVKVLFERLQTAEKEGVRVYRTRAQCLSFCKSGPLLVVYPDGVWYHSVTPEVAVRIVEEHIKGGKVVKEYAFANNPLSGG